MQNVEYASVQQALDRLKGLSADAETRQRAWVRERALKGGVVQFGLYLRA